MLCVLFQNLFMWINKSLNIKNIFAINHTVFEYSILKGLNVYVCNMTTTKTYFFLLINHIRITSFDCNFFMGMNGDAQLSTRITALNIFKFKNTFRLLSSIELCQDFHNNNFIQKKRRNTFILSEYKRYIRWRATFESYINHKILYNTVV